LAYDLESQKENPSATLLAR